MHDGGWVGVVRLLCEVLGNSPKKKAGKKKQFCW